MATYYSMSTENAAACGWTVLGVGRTAAEAEVDAEERLPSAGRTDFTAATWRRNLTTLSESAARKRGFIPRKAVVVYDAEDDGPGGYHFEF